ncbi:MAG TPA: hypothetical protein VLA79_19105, partial [Polyangia bacterium]|nr:hypothetical protein [Polyangia bacterium]
MRSLDGLAILGLGVVLGGACGRTPSARAAPVAARAPKFVVADPAALVVPRVAGPVVIDAELEGKKMWEGDTGTTRNFKDAAGHGMVPYTEAKARWGDGKLYLMLYAGDLDLQGTVRAHDGPVERDDAFHLEFGRGDEVRVISVSVLGTVTDALCRPSRTDPTGRVCDRSWESHARVAVDRDGTLNKIGDNDEEWVIEMAVPLAALGVADAHGGTRIPFSVHRCEIGHGSSRGCGGWGA